MLSRTKITLVLILSYNWSRLNDVLTILTFVDHSLSLIISFLDLQASFALTTTNTCSLKSQALYSQATPWGWPDGLEHNSRIPLYKSFYEQVFLRGSTKVYDKASQASEALHPYFKEGGGIQGSVAAFLQDSPSKIFFPTSRLTQERRKIEYQQATYKKSIRFAIEFFCPTSRSIQESKGLFIWQATYKGNGSTGKPRKPLSPPGLVYCHKKRAWESREKKRKRPRKARRWLQRRQRSVCPKPRIHFFFGSRVLGIRSSPSWWM